MPMSIDIFVGSEASSDSFVADVERLLDITLQRVSSEEEVWFEFRNPHVVLTVGEHEFENDRDLDFEDYRYDISIRALNMESEQDRKKWREDFANFVFQRLEEARQYHLLMVERLQRKLDEYHPT